MAARSEVCRRLAATQSAGSFQVSDTEAQSMKTMSSRAMLGLGAVLLLGTLGTHQRLKSAEQAGIRISLAVRRQVQFGPLNPKSSCFRREEERVKLDPRKTAVIVVAM